DDIYRNLGGGESVHLADYPSEGEFDVDPELERDMETARTIVELARNVRNETGIKTRQPLSELLVSFTGAFDLGKYEDIIRDEVNVKKITVVPDDSGFVEFSLKLNLVVAGKKYGRLVAPIQKALKELPPERAREAVQQGFIELDADGGRVKVTLDELLVEKRARTGFASAASGGLTVALNTEITPELAQEGLVREVIRA